MKNINIKTKFVGFGNHYFVNTDNKRLQQVLLNLISNAVKFTDRDGKIKIKCTLEYQTLYIKVIDSGIGIKRRDQEKLFKMFGSIKNEKKKVNTEGIGLGLVISQLITKKFGG